MNNRAALFTVIGALACVGSIVGISYAVKSAATISQSEIKTDPDTGCEYLVGGYGYTPRLDVDGKQICRQSHIDNGL